MILEQGDQVIVEDNKGPTGCSDNLGARYQRAQSLMQGALGSKKFVANATVIPHWIGESELFWYLSETKEGGRYRLVDAKKRSNQSAFDHESLADALAKASGESIDPNNLPLKNIDMDPSLSTITFSAFNAIWIYNGTEKQCKKLGLHSNVEKISPDGKTAAFVRGFNLWVRDVATGKERALTDDGEKLCVYGSFPTAVGVLPAPLLDLLWSPDSTRLFTHIIDTRDVNLGMPLVQHVPTDGSLRPRINRPDRRVALHDDEHVEKWRLLTIDVEQGRIQNIDYDAIPMSYPPYSGYFYAGRGWWGSDSRHVYFVYHESNGTGMRVMKCDTQTGRVNTVLEENPEDQATIFPAMHCRTAIMPLPDSEELIWYSERSGWPHLYLYDLTSGQLKNTLTQGDWAVRDILHCDATRRELIIQTAGRVEGRNPYYRDICRVDLDTGELTAWLSSDDEYTVANNSSMQFGVEEKGVGVAPGNRYLVITRSRVDDIPVSVLLDRDGEELLVLEAADVSELPVNWQWPEPVMLKGADGQTDIYGVVFRPSTFSADKIYPVVDLSFSVSEPAGSFCNNAMKSFQYFYPQAYAELGFIVVKFNVRSDGIINGAGLRDRAFNAYRDTRLPFSNKADCVAGITQLCERYPYMDIARVGVVDIGALPGALTGLFIYPDLYKVGVSINPLAASGGLYPINIGGACEFPPLENFADNLCGKLLLIAGMLDEAVPVSSTFRIIDALQKSNKHFDMLLLPNDGHSPSAYAMQRGWDYLVTHLLGAEPPERFRLAFN